VPWDLIGHPRAVQALQTAVENDAVQHAYMFVGPDGVGRATAARRLAQALNCIGEKPPCLECAQCRRVEGGIHADVQTLTIEEAEEGPAKKAISIEQLRDAEAQMALAPYEGRTRVVVVDPADALQGPAQNAFLKTLEEPPPNVVIVLIVQNPDLLLETILSRCARLGFGLVATEEIEAGLAARGVDQETAKLLARLSGGRPGWAVAAAADPSVLKRRRDAIEMARSLPRMSMEERFSLAERLMAAFREDRDLVLRRIGDWQRWWRDVFLVQSGAGESALNVDMLSELRADSEAFDRAEVLRFVESSLDTVRYLKGNVQTRIALDALMLAVPSARLRV
jgi:DNA polymerase-3 subunit delta'